jgi:glutamyl-tRNA reductase
MKLRKNRSLLLVDIAVPRDIDPAVNFMPDVYLYNIDDLQTIAADYLNQRKEEIVRCEEIIREKVKALSRESRCVDANVNRPGVPCSVFRGSESKGCT